jgi:aspartyl-tRNA(Asn)/glutamyl-tRNA(Gln) amidotransferase subunit C
MAISIEEVDRIAKLARLKFSEEEKVKFQTDLSSILDYVDQLKEVQTKLTDEINLEGANLMRDDVAEDSAIAVRDGLLSQAPAREGDFIKVKSILE